MITVSQFLALVVLGGGGDRTTLLPEPPIQALATVAEQVRRSWAGQRADAVIGQADGVLLQLPGQRAGAGVSRDQAVRLLGAVFRRTEELETRVVSSREVGPGQGYVELERSYRLSGTAEERSQRVLLAFRRGPEGGGWGLVELRVVEGDG
ncbi:MAG TPA: hypothetical protein VMK53_10665 [Gemmatimonadales bacterium]|nr:hypothetical protein [Gemmatimonadales bacterium]